MNTEYFKVKALYVYLLQKHFILHLCCLGTFLKSFGVKLFRSMKNVCNINVVHILRNFPFLITQFIYSIFLEDCDAAGLLIILII